MTIVSPNCQGFDPIIAGKPKILILGSMPGIESINQQRYYAHPRNVFWSIMAHCYNFSEDLQYRERCKRLITHHVAVWDVLARCIRPGSLDSQIKPQLRVFNRFEVLFEQYPSLSRIVFNGAKAESLFFSKYKGVFPKLEFRRVPSTSPAYAAMSLEHKKLHWYKALNN